MKLFRIAVKLILMMIPMMMMKKMTPGQEMRKRWLQQLPSDSLCLQSLRILGMMKMMMMLVKRIGLGQCLAE